MSDKGVVYVAMGARFVEEAQISARSVRKHMPNLPITLFTDSPPDGSDLFDRVAYLTRSGPKPHRDKLVGMMRSPYEQTLFLDTDTFIGADVSEVFEILRHFHMAATLDWGYRDSFPKGTGVPDAFREFNLGVVFFHRSTAMLDALARALSMYDQLGEQAFGSEQPAFRVVSYDSTLRTAVLSAEYNCRFANFGQVTGEVKILHGRIPRGTHSEHNLATVLARINRTHIPRVFVAGRVHALARNPLPFSRPYFDRHMGSLFPLAFLYNLRSLLRRLRRGFKR